MTDKKIVQYNAAFFGGSDPVGQSIWLATVDHPDCSVHQSVYGVNTSRVVSYDETTGIIETLNTVYVPSGGDNSQA